MIMAMIRPETEMKYSGLAWEKFVPIEWNKCRLKDYFEFEKGKNAQIYTKDYIGLHKGSFPVYSGQTENDGVMGEIDTYDYELDECLFSTTVGAKVMTPKVLSGKFSLSQNCLIMRKIRKCVIRFVYYTLFPLFDYERAKIPAYMQPSLRIEDLKTYNLYMPLYTEQKKIADYLDKTCLKIDEIIEEAKASTYEYKRLKQSVIDKAVLHGLCNGMMKDSGNDLIGKIPLSWEMRKLKYVADFNPGITIAYDAQKEVGYVPMNCVKNGYMNPLSARLSDMSTGLTGFQDGDIVIAKVTPCFENGNIAVAENLEQSVAFGSSELFVIRTHSINRRFMLYYLQNSVFKNQCISTMTGTGGLKRVSGYFVNNAYITYPPENEQQVIVDYLDEAVKNMDSLIAEKESLINDLEAYKKSLIYEVVTGKRMVV